MSDDKDSLFDIYNGQGFSPVLVTIFGAKWLVGLIGVVLNGNLVYITIVNRSIHSACNWLLALNALLNLCYQANHIIPLLISLNGRNFIDLPLCFYLQLYSVFAVNCNLGIYLSIGVDRMLCVLLPTCPVSCTALDCYQGDLGILVSRNALIFYLFNLGCYTVVWALFITAAIKRETMKDTITQRLFKSLTVIMLMEIFSVSTNWVARLT
uniref:G-protein coupled receptors family 1 profile domain-containing protein n=1 Tax=Ditylenchus dipsaci TaxID=166011 RepID=A0A915E4P3_9BILA